MSNNLTTDGTILQDKKKNGKERPWQFKMLQKSKTEIGLRDNYLIKRADRMAQCGEVLVFMTCPKCDDKKLKSANFCKDRLCPLCSWRRSDIVFAQLMQILHKTLELEPKMRFLFLTLTAKNAIGNDLSKEISNFLEGFDRLFKYKEIDKQIQGYIRRLEITYNKEKDTYHHHLHVLIAVKPSYFGGDNYIKQARWAELFGKALKIDYIPIVDVRAVSKIVKAVAETSKYAVKDTDYLHKNQKISSKVIGVLANALHGRRLLGYGKLFKQIKADLKLQDVESDNADLICKQNETADCQICNTQMYQEVFKWSEGHKNFLISLGGTK
jgi:plasmid rolling circle replication initiator protein Rep